MDCGANELPGILIFDSVHLLKVLPLLAREIGRGALGEVGSSMYSWSI